MTMSARARKFALTAHITVSVGWLGSVIAFLALSIVGLTNQDAQKVRAVYFAMKLTGCFVIVPLSITSLLTGLIQSLGTNWGLFKHYWIVFKLLINLFATIVLLMYIPTLNYLAEIAANTKLSTRELLALRDPSPVVHSSLALILLLVATTLGVYKPRGLTPYGWRKERESRKVSLQ